MSTTESDTLTVSLTPIGPGPEASVRFKRALKALRRSYGLRAHWPSPAIPPAVADAGGSQLRPARAIRREKARGPDSRGNAHE